MLDHFISIVVMGLAVYRLAQFLVYDDGPLDVFQRLRVWAGVYDLGPNGQPERSTGRFLACPYCVSVWLSGVVWLVWQCGPVAQQVVGLGAIAGLVTLFLDRRGT